MPCKLLHEHKIHYKHECIQKRRKNKRSLKSLQNVNICWSTASNLLFKEGRQKKAFTSLLHWNSLPHNVSNNNPSYPGAWFPYGTGESRILRFCMWEPFVFTTSVWRICRLAFYYFIHIEGPSADVDCSKHWIKNVWFEFSMFEEQIWELELLVLPRTRFIRNWQFVTFSHDKYILLLQFEPLWP